MSSLAHQVTDLLRGKLHHQGCQLADAQSRITELEGEKRGVMQEFLQARQEGKDEFEVLVSVGSLYIPISLLVNY